MTPDLQPSFKPIPVAALQTLEPALRAEVSRRCPDFLRGQQDDLVQSGLLRLARALDRGQPLKRSYVNQVAWSVTVDAIRKARRTADQPTAEGAAALEGLQGGRSPEEAVAHHELQRALRDCLEALSQASKDVITLHLMGHTIRESSEMLGVTHKQADNRIYRGMAALRRCLRNKGVQP